MTARQLASTPSSHQDGMTARQHDGMTAESPLDIHALLHEKGTQKTTVRLPDELLNKLDETLYTIRRQHHTRLSMNAVFVAALASFCAEFAAQGTESPLYKLLTENPS
jgi:hypothetical protein